MVNGGFYVVHVFFILKAWEISQAFFLVVLLNYQFIDSKIQHYYNKFDIKMIFTHILTNHSYIYLKLSLHLFGYTNIIYLNQLLRWKIPTQIGQLKATNPSWNP